jgi:hypothetical protein
MTKYKTDAEKLKFFNDAKAARIAKANEGILMRGMTTPGEINDPNPNEPKGPDPNSFYTNTTAGELQGLSNPVSPSDVINRLKEFKNRPYKKGGSVKRKKRK